MNFEKIEEAMVEIKNVNEKDLYTGGEFCVIDRIPVNRNMSNNGGDYEFWRTFTPTKIKGIYRKESHCSCDFDRCGCGFIGFEIITKKRKDELDKESL